MVIDLHTHTSSGSRCGYQTPHELIAQAKRIGLDGVCLTEHDWVWPISEVEALAAAHGLLVIGGAEVTSDMGDILVFGVHRPVRDIFKIEDLRALVDEEGGVMMVAHPFRGRLGNGLSVDEACDWPVFRWTDGLEVFNGRSFAREASFACAVARKLGLLGCGGSDAHASGFVGDAVTILDRAVHSEAGFVEELRCGRFHAEHRLLRQSYSAREEIQL
ncbi:MAG: PHP domain-containing protein [Chloroflexi bacterium]|nr:PHP domain-containing protein [Chloroflexota bacterium]